ncbi:MAG TPA: hypothetical protein VHL51_12915 [Gaiellales bacterium]|jgi:hypothetical protein|nr:hypothetical protein [Gaiellales bacterium]
MSDADPLGREPAPMSDLFATAVHRFGNAWADLVVATWVVVAVGFVPVLAVSSSHGPSDVFVASCLSFGVAYFVLLGFVVLRGLPVPAPRSRVVATYAAAVVTGLIAGVVVLVLQPYAVVPLPVLLLIVPAIAAGDATALGGFIAGPRLAFGNFTRTWTMWTVTILFCAPIVIAMFLMLTSLAGSVKATLLALALSAPIAWPVSALFIRALYGDITGRAVVAPQDRTR